MIDGGFNTVGNSDAGSPYQRQQTDHFFHAFTPLNFEEPKTFDDNFPKKPPTAFISSQDWSLYVRICCHIRQIQTQYGCSDKEAVKCLPPGPDGRRRGSCIVRMIAAFNRLYGEYTILCDAIASAKFDSEINSWKQDNQQQDYKKTDSHRKRHHRGNSKHATKDNDLKFFEAQTKSNLNEKSQNQNAETIRPRNGIVPRARSRLSTYSPMPMEGPSPLTIDTLSTRLPSASSSLMTQHYTQTPTSNDSNVLRKRRKGCFLFTKKHKSSKNKWGPKGVNIYDCIQRQPPDSSLWVSQISVNKTKIEHIVHLPEDLSMVCRTDGDEQPLRLPIGLELTLPRMQRQIETILSACRYVYDPLEVIAELRTVNYDTKACISYFERSKILREIIQEFLPTRTMRVDVCHSNRTNNNELTAQTSKVQNTVICTEEKVSLFGMNEDELESLLHSFQQRLGNLRKLHTDTMRRVQRMTIFAGGLSSVIKQLLPKSLSSNGDGANGEEPNKNTLEMHNFQVTKLTNENLTLRETLRQEEERRKSVFNMMQEYLGNIRVFCRCRLIPQLGRCLEVNSLDSVTLIGGPNPEEYHFDRVFDTNVSQSEIYAELTPLVHSFLDGFNVCFLTYGGEASGKTFTLIGGNCGQPENQGIVQRSLQTLLTERAIRQHDWDLNLSVAVVEVYNDTFIDLLSGESGIHLRVDLGVDKMTETLKSMAIQTKEDINELLQLCKNRRKIGKTALNPVSSRSHLIILAKLRATSVIHGTRFNSVLALCDLAGFEDVIKADTLGDYALAKEAGFINRSLSALNRVFTSLRTQDPMTVSYRDSKLTYLLKPFFTNSGKCILIVTVRTDRANLPSTQGTLRFGRDSRAVSLGRARRQVSLERLIQDVKAM